MRARRVDNETMYDQLRTDITSGRLPAGTPVREVAVAERFGVSRTPVREVLRRLQHDRLLESRDRGLHVRAPDPEEVVQVYDARILLEAEAAEQAARTCGKSDLARLEGLLARDRGLTGPDDATRAHTNIEFHEAMWQATNNPVLVDLLHRLTIHLVRTPRSTLSAPGRWEESLDEHGRLVEAIGEGDSEEAGRITRDHMRKARDLRLSMLRQEMISSS
ncbi:DNA-binding GntR family transcriptional regulator [Saccharopolyspora lacisalsi]|uniref:DNA-binding GntR family transcriptional regulator n=1 Tax=Halosaccharopolyspora lacisalsi TaxID=1000566 RepID=A0A839E0I5_9PSEU|nr:GntR family transcriptional regulator [Halosaccharopolyspora lacisalsi]MBA8826429.1 DNA-binding GntR family transcriptional regulator [Halosaccharopolyspora lacisalsi]